MKTQPAKLLNEYWNEVRGDRLAPRRFEIEPARLAAILPDTFILERIGDMDIRYRLAGTRIIEQFGQDFRASSFFDGFVHSDQRLLERQLRIVMTKGAGLLFEITSTAPSGRTVVHECLILPLIHMRDTVDRFLACIAPIDTPDWLGEEPLSERTLTAFEIVGPPGSGATIHELPPAHPPALDPTMRTARIVRANRRYFRVYDGGLTDQSADQQASFTTSRE